MSVRQFHNLLIINRLYYAGQICPDKFVRVFFLRKFSSSLLKHKTFGGFGTFQAKTFGGFGTYMYLCAQNQQVMRKRIFKRKVYDKMLEWKRERNGSTALLLKGAHRVGKSTAAKAFAENEYKSYILIDFVQASKEVKLLFDNLMELNYIFLRLQSIYQVILEPRKSTIIFDEVQMCPQARQAIIYPIS